MEKKNKRVYEKRKLLSQIKVDFRYDIGIIQIVYCVVQIHIQEIKFEDQNSPMYLRRRRPVLFV